MSIPAPAVDDGAALPSHLVDGLDLASLRLLLAVDELGSVAQAARRLGIAQPSATVRLRNLERLLGVPLLERAPTGSELTATGRLVGDAAVTVLHAANRVFQEAERGREGAARLVIGAPRTVARFHVAALLDRAATLDGAAPDPTVVDIVENDTRTVAQAVRTGAVSIGFVAGPLAPLGLRSQIVDSVELAVITPCDHRLARSELVAPGDLVAAGMVVRREGSGTRDVVEAALTPHGFGRAGRLIEVSSDEAVLANVASGVAAGVVPVALLSERQGVARLSIGLDLVQPIRLCWAGTRPAHRAAARLVDALSAASGESPASAS